MDDPRLFWCKISGISLFAPSRAQIETNKCKILELGSQCAGKGTT
jgi:hypothetical protein